MLEHMLVMSWLGAGEAWGAHSRDVIWVMYGEAGNALGRWARHMCGRGGNGRRGDARPVSRTAAMCA